MQIRRVVTLAVAVAVLAGAPALVAQNNQPNRRDQERRSQADQRDIQALVQTVDAVASGKQPAPADIPLRWDGNHFLRGGDGSTYIPFTVVADASKLSSPATAMYIRVVNKNAAAAAPRPAPAADQNNRNRNQPAPAAATYPWDNVNFIEVKGDGKIARAIALKPGEYEMFVMMKERGPLEPPRNAPPAKMGMLRRDLTVPDFGGMDITTSSVLLGSVEQIATPLTPEQQQDEPVHVRQHARRAVGGCEAQEERRAPGPVLGLWHPGQRRQAGRAD